MRKYEITAYLDGENFKDEATCENYHKLLFDIRVSQNWGFTYVGCILPGEMSIDGVKNLLSKDDDKIKHALDEWVKSALYRVDKIKRIM